VVAAFAIPLAACDPTDILSKEETQSPDGYWTVQTVIQRTSGPGINSMDTYVFLSRTSDKGKGTQILGLNDNTEDQGGVEVNWRDKTHLELSRHPATRVDFQVVKFADVEISLREAGP
jgi:hypothetical protein